MHRILESVPPVLLSLAIAACGAEDDGTGGNIAGATTSPIFPGGGAAGIPGGAASTPGGAVGIPGGGATGTLGGAAGVPGGGATSTAGGAAGIPAGGATSAGGASAGGTLGAAGALGIAGAMGMAGAPVMPEPDGPEPVLITSADNAFWQEGTVTEMAGGNAAMTVNEGQTYQRWLGFGGTFNEMGWDALSVLSPADRDRAIKLLFDRTEGIGFTFGRIPMGSSDYGMDRYTLAETAGDFAMASFSIERDKKMLIPYIKAALAVKSNIQFWSSPWTPPPWMKDNNAYDRGNMKGDAQTLGAYALYFSKFVQAYGAEGIKVGAVSPQNEPGYPQDYPSCGWAASVFTDFVANHLGPALAAQSPGTDIWMGTMSNPVSDALVKDTMGNGKARGYIKGIGLQWGMDVHAAGYASTYKLPVHQTEHRCGNYPWVDGTNQSKAPNDYAYGKETWALITGWITKNVNSYAAWNMVLDTVGRSLDEKRPWAQNALLAVDRNSKTLKITPAYYVFRHLGQYVEPGATRIGVSGDNALAFKNPDGSVVTIIYNPGGSASQTTLSVKGTVLQFSVPAGGWATVNWAG